MNEQQETIAVFGGLLIVIQQIRNGLIPDLFNLVMGNPTKLANLPQDLLILLWEVFIVFVLVFLASGDQFGDITVGFVAMMALATVFLVENGPDVVNWLKAHQIGR